MRPHDQDVATDGMPGANFELPPGATFEPAPQTAYDVNSSEKSHGI
jgi:hypothetical protein